ncbi:hypothetical protein CHUAL_012332 [Chamberlinius hualienensis]
MSSHGTPVKKVPIHLQSAQNRILIKGGQIINDDMTSFADVYVEDGVIKQVGRDLHIPGGTKIIDARGKLIIPGGIDAHTHFQMPSALTTTADDFYSGTKAALAGGTTMIIDVVMPKSNESITDVYKKWRSWADPKACCDYGLHVAVQTFNNKVKQEMEILSKENGVNSFYISLASQDEKLSDDDLINIFQCCKEVGAVARVHAENGDAIKYLTKKLLKLGVTGPEGHEQSRPEDLEAAATMKAIALANLVNCPIYIVRVNSQKSAEVIASRRQEGVICYGEVLAAAVGTGGIHQYNKCWRHAAGHVTSPPLRPDLTTPTDLLNMLGSGNLQVAVSDDCTYKSDQKALGKADFSKIPSGVNGVEDRMSIIWEKGVATGLLDPCQFVAVTSTNAAKIFNLYPKKGRIAIGSDADIVLWDANKTRTISAKSHNQAVDFNIFEGMTCRGVPECVITNGHIVVEDGEVHVTQGLGRFVSMQPFAPFVYNKIQKRDQSRGIKKVDRDSNVPEEVEQPVIRQIVSPIAAVYSAPSPVSTNGSTNSFGRRNIIAEENPAMAQAKGQDQFYSRPLTKGGARNMQDSTFSLSGAQIDDSKGLRPSIKVHNPPGGRSTSPW